MDTYDHPNGKTYKVDTVKRLTGRYVPCDLCTFNPSGKGCLKLVAGGCSEKIGKYGYLSERPEPEPKSEDIQHMTEEETKEQDLTDKLPPLDLPKNYRIKRIGAPEKGDIVLEYVNDKPQCLLMEYTCSSGAYVILEREPLKGEDLVGMICAVSNTSYEHAKNRTTKKAYSQFAVVVEHDPSEPYPYRVFMGDNYRYAYPAAAEDIKKMYTKALEAER